MTTQRIGTHDAMYVLNIYCSYRHIQLSAN